MDKTAEIDEQLRKWEGGVSESPEVRHAKEWLRETYNWPDSRWDWENNLPEVLANYVTMRIGIALQCNRD